MFLSNQPMRKIIILAVIILNTLSATSDDDDGVACGFFRNWCCCRRPAIKKTLAVTLPDISVLVEQSPRGHTGLQKSKSQNDLECALSKLDAVVKASDFTPNSFIADIAAQLDVNFPHRSASVEVQKYIHDIRHCLTVMAYALELLGETPDDSTTIQSLQSGLKYLTEMIPKIYKSDWTSVETVRPAPQILSEIIASTVSLCGMPAKRALVAFTYSPTTEFSCVAVESELHALNIRRVLYNLIHNAVHYTEGTSNPAVMLIAEKYYERRRWWARFIVKDNGPGMTSDVIASLFQLHYRAETTSHQSGSGIGLYSSKGLVDGMRGEMGATSEGPGRGSTFWFCIPCIYSASPLASIPRVIRAKKITKDVIRVLIVDDVIVNCTILERMCQRFGIKTAETARTGDEACAKFSAAPHNLIFMDMRLGGDTDGMETTQIIRRHVINESELRPVIFSISGDADMESNEEFISAGMDDCLVKPFSLQGLGDRLIRHFDFT